MSSNWTLPPVRLLLLERRLSAELPCGIEGAYEERAEACVR